MFKTKNRSVISRQTFFDKSVHLKEIKDCISGNNETEVLKVISSLGYKLGTDFVRQHPIGSKFVVDVAFPNEQIAIEIDGDEHRRPKQARADNIRDNFLRTNNWLVLRIMDKDFFGYKLLFYKYLIDELVKERREQYQIGTLYPIDIPDFVE